MSPLAAARYLAAHYAQHPTEQERLDLATAIARAYADASGAPGRAIAKFIEHNVRRDKVEQARVRALARELHAQGEWGEDGAVEAQFLSVPSFARRLALPVAPVRRLLRTKAGRRALGWPVHLGHGSFLCPGAAADPIGRSQFFAGLSEDEPPHPEPLPAGYER